MGLGKPAVSFDEGFWPSVHKLDPAQSHRVIKALNLFAENPEHPNLKLKPLRGELGDLMSLRAGRDVRVLLVRRGDAYVWLEAGLRRDIYERAARGRFVINPNRRFMGFVDPETPTPERRRPRPTGDVVEDTPRRAFDHWTDRELAEAGFGEDEIRDLRSCLDEYELLALPWPEDRLDLAVRLVEQSPEQWRAGVDSEARLRDAIDAYGGLTGISPLFTPEELDRIAKAPIEDWMVFLHPDQRRLVTRSFSGPARVRGAAGTGKSVVALHRAVHLAQRATPEEPVLFTTVVPWLPRVLDQLHRRMPSARPDLVVFRSVGEVAREVLAAVGRTVDVDGDAARALLDEVVRDIGVDLPFGPQYLYEEVSRVIAGRGMTYLDDYLTASRVGRRQGLAPDVRRQVWDVYTAWLRRLDDAGVVDAPVAAHRALAAVRDGAQVPAHTAVVVDEAQDLTMVELLLLRAIANQGSRRDRPDGLLLVGDGAQRVQAGGYTLRAAGVEVRGRTSVLRVNYRNTAEILEAALAVAGDEVVLDLDEEVRRGELRPTSLRHGLRPRLLTFDGDDAELDRLVPLIADLDESALIARGDIGVFVPPAQLDLVATGLEQGGVPVRLVRDYDGTTDDRVKVGTHAEAKGLEFKAVLLPRLSASHFPEPAAEGESEAEIEERASLELSRLFVAMTRARDVLIVTAPGEPAGVIGRAKEAFDVS